MLLELHATLLRADIQLYNVFIMPLQKQDHGGDQTAASADCCTSTKRGYILNLFYLQAAI